MSRCRDTTLRPRDPETALRRSTSALSASHSVLSVSRSVFSVSCSQASVSHSVLNVSRSALSVTMTVHHLREQSGTPDGVAYSSSSGASASWLLGWQATGGASSMRLVCGASSAGALARPAKVHARFAAARRGITACGRSTRQRYRGRGRPHSQSCDAFSSETRPLAYPLSLADYGGLGARRGWLEKGPVVC